MNQEKEQIANLCRCAEEAFGRPVAKAKDFDGLAVAIFERTGTLLSPTTLKRVWGYLSEATATRRSTLDVLARYCGWYSFDEFLSGNNPEIESGFVGSKILNAATDLKPGNCITLMWQPARICQVRYLGDSRWEVRRAEGTRLEAGDTFECGVIMAGEPLYLNHLTHDGVDLGVYICGRRTGVTFHPVIAPQE